MFALSIVTFTYSAVWLYKSVKFIWAVSLYKFSIVAGTVGTVRLEITFPYHHHYHYIFIVVIIIIYTIWID